MVQRRFHADEGFTHQHPPNDGIQLYLSENGPRRLRRTFRKLFVRSKIFPEIDHAVEIGPKIVEIGAILAIFRPFEDFSLRYDIWEIQMI